MNLDNIEMAQAVDATPAQFILSLLQIRDQAHIMHWQTQKEREHRVFGEFYEEYLGLVDVLVEGILGKYGTQVLSFEEAALGLTSYSQDYRALIGMLDSSFELFTLVFDAEEDSELYNELDNMRMLRNKINYLLSQE